MSRFIQFAIFLTVVFLIDFGGHWYYGVRLIADPVLPEPWATILFWVLMGLALSVPFGFVLSRLLPRWLARVLVVPIHTWLGVMLLLMTLLVFGDLFRLSIWLVDLLFMSGAWFADPALGLALSRWQALLVAGATVVLTIWSMVRALATPRVVQVQVPMGQWPAELAGLRIAQLSDLHLGPSLGRSFCRRVVEQTNAANPDLVVITGDLVDESVRALSDAVAPLADLRAPLGVFFVTGNHEFYAGWPPWREHLKKLGIRVLENERVPIERDGQVFDLAGIHDLEAGRMDQGARCDLRAALANPTPDRPVVLLSHQVRVIDRAADAGVGLVISGHNHGGQIWPWGLIVYLQQPFLAGLHRRSGCWAYISQGAGFWGPPMRLGTRSEIGLLHLVAEGK